VPTPCCSASCGVIVRLYAGDRNGGHGGNTSVVGSRIAEGWDERIWGTHRVYLVLIEVKIILGEGGEEEHDLGLDNGVYVRIGRIVVVHCTARSSCPSAGRLRATRSHACTGSRFRDNVVGMGWKGVGWEALFVGRESG